MCEWCDEFLKYHNMGIYNHPNNSHWVKKIVAKVRRATCPVCGESLSLVEMNPSNSMCSRSLCQKCYNEKILQIHSSCIVCGDNIQHKIPLQANGNGIREIKNHICDRDECDAQWALMHTVVLGYIKPFADRGDSKPAPLQHTLEMTHAKNADGTYTPRYAIEQERGVIEGELTDRGGLHVGKSIPFQSGVDFAYTQNPDGTYTPKYGYEEEENVIEVDLTDRGDLRSGQPIPSQSTTGQAQGSDGTYFRRGDPGAIERFERMKADPNSGLGDSLVDHMLDFHKGEGVFRNLVKKNFIK